MKKLVLLAISFCTALALYSIIFADTSKIISFQGRITDNFGNPITETGNFNFRFDDGEKVADFSTYSYVSRGLYSVNIDVTDLSQHIDFNNNVNVTINYNDADIGQTLLTASPYAFFSTSSTYSIFSVSSTYLKGPIDGTLITNNTDRVNNPYQIFVASAQYAVRATSANYLTSNATVPYSIFSVSSTYLRGSIDGSQIRGPINGTLIANNTNGVSGPYQIFVASAQYAAARGADLAEIYASKENLEPGDVVEISLDVDNNIEKSKSPESSRVAGVVSTNPGLLINSKELGYRLALVGKVPVKVTNEGGNIMRGDLLTTSSISGHAKKATNPKPGRIIGKALENFNSTEGIILVLVNLQ
jgi:hypothetical protein